MFNNPSRHLNRNHNYIPNPRCSPPTSRQLQSLPIRTSKHQLRRRSPQRIPSALHVRRPISQLELDLAVALDDLLGKLEFVGRAVRVECPVLVCGGQLAQAFEAVGGVDFAPGEEGAFAVDLAFEDGRCKVESESGLGYSGWDCGDAQCSAKEGVDEE